jgi:hypothetical protein
VFMSQTDARRLRSGAPVEGLASLRDAITKALSSPDT